METIYVNYKTVGGPSADQKQSAPIRRIVTAVCKTEGAAKRHEAQWGRPYIAMDRTVKRGDQLYF